MTDRMIRLRTELAGTLNDPRAETPPRQPGSVRRSTVIDTLHPDGPGSGLLVVATGRDARTRQDRSLQVLDAVTLEARLDPDRILLSVSGGPAGLQDLVGLRVGAGFRAALSRAVPDEAAEGTVAHQLVDDWVGATLVAGMAELDVAGPVATQQQVDRQNANVVYSTDLCAGWASDATLIATTISHEVMPITLGPLAPDLGRADDPDGWPPARALQPGDSRRARRLDLTAEGGHQQLDVHFRDSWVGIDTQTRVVHEYSLAGEYDPVEEVLTSVLPTAHVLPWPECPAALASATRVVGLALPDLRQTVRREFVGITTCTHLNDVVRSLADLPVLARQVR